MVFLSGNLTRLRELLVSYNRLNCVPEELCSCECLERLELAMNRDLDELPQQVVGLTILIENVSHPNSKDIGCAWSQWH